MSAWRAYRHCSSVCLAGVSLRFFISAGCAVLVAPALRTADNLSSAMAIDTPDARRRSSKACSMPNAFAAALADPTRPHPPGCCASSGHRPHPFRPQACADPTRPTRGKPASSRAAVASASLPLAFQPRTVPPRRTHPPDPPVAENFPYFRLSSLNPQVRQSRPVFSAQIHCDSQVHSVSFIGSPTRFTFGSVISLTLNSVKGGTRDMAKNRKSPNKLGQWARLLRALALVLKTIPDILREL